MKANLVEIFYLVDEFCKEFYKAIYRQSKRVSRHKTENPLTCNPLYYMGVFRNYFPNLYPSPTLIVEFNILALSLSFKALTNPIL